MKLIVLLGIFFISFGAAAKVVTKSLYGEDDRKLVKELSNTEKDSIEYSKSVLAMVPQWKISSETDDYIFVNSESLSNGLNYCSQDKFSDLPMVSSCSGFLIDQDILVTAGHCIKDQNDCLKNKWILDYNDAGGFQVSKSEIMFYKSNVVSCSKLMGSIINGNTDYAVIKLDHKITDRGYLELRKHGKLDNKESLTIIGHPYGLPKILASNGVVYNNDEKDFFTTYIDSFSGNSGSPIIGVKSKMVEGILIKGEKDFEMDIENGCNKNFSCKGQNCKGETVLRSSVISLSPYLKKQ